MMQRAWSHFELPTSGDQYLQSIDHELGAGLCIVGTRETDVLRLCVDVNVRGESEVGVGTVFYGSPGRGALGRPPRRDGAGVGA